MFINLLYDALNDFGKLTAAGDCPNIINMGDASADQIRVDLKLPDADFSGGPLVAKIRGSDTENGAYEDIVTSGSVTKEMITDGYGLPIPKTKFKFLKVTISGAFTGSVQAIINSYKGI
jgi:hypothetical protein